MQKQMQGVCYDKADRGRGYKGRDSFMTSIKYRNGFFNINSLKSIKNLRINEYEKDDLNLPYELIPKEFLKYAKADITLKSNRGIVNALSNTKRALHCQVDSLLYAFGYEEKSKKKNFYEKLEILTGLDIVTPEFLRKINNMRNLLEHEYNIPSREDVEDALDFVALFIEYTQKFLDNILKYCQIVLKSGKESPKIGFDRKNKKFILFEYVLTGNNLEEKVLKEFGIDTPEFDIILKFFAHADKALI